MVFRSRDMYVTPWRVPFASVTLPYHLPARPSGPLGLVSALAGSASTLTALHGLPTAELERSRDRGLAAFTRLRALTLRLAPVFPAPLSASLLPAGLEELTVELVDTRDSGHPIEPPPLAAFSTLQSLRRVTFTGYYSEWHFSSSRADGWPTGCLQLPASLEVCPSVPGLAIQCRLACCPAHVLTQSMSWITLHTVLSCTYRYGSNNSFMVWPQNRYYAVDQCLCRLHGCTVPQALRIDGDDEEVDLQGISTHGRFHALRDDLEDIDRGRDPARRSLLGPVAVALEVWAKKAVFNLAYTPEYGPGAKLLISM